jgi:hypothetical protein
MKGRKTGGMDSPASGDKEYAQDLAMKPTRRNNAPKVMGAAEERKHGGRTKKMVGKMSGDMAACNAGRKPRKSGGRAGCDSSPFSSARSGTPAKGRQTVSVD